MGNVRCVNYMDDETFGKASPWSICSLESFQPTLVSTTRVTEKSKLEYPTIHFAYKFIFF